MEFHKILPNIIKEVAKQTLKS